MGSIFRRSLAALAALSALLLSLTKIGVTPIAPGSVTGFRQSRSCADGTLCFATDRGNLTSFVTLRLRPKSPPQSRWTAMLSDSTPLAVRVRPLTRGYVELKVVKADSSRRLAKFEWSSGLELILKNDAGGVYEVEDWRVDLPDREGADTLGRARWRTQWMIICLGLLGIGAFAAVFDALTKSARQPGVRDLCSDLVRLTISEVDGESAEDPKAMRELLTAVLLGTTPSSEAVARYAGKKSYARAKKVWFTARSRFQGHWFKVLHILEDYTEKLDDSANE
ncbi:MAG TPA: hypothetical protein VFJ16_29535 [Longimicrobium sp.]|nr:hypothetical protein [Longimicrobium sp.]